MTQARAAQKFRIVVSFYPPRTGGIERYTAALVRELLRRGHEVEVITAGTGSPVSLWGERVTTLPTSVLLGRLPFPHLWRRETWSALARVRSGDVTLVQSHLFVSGVLGALLTPRRRPVLWVNHGSGHVTSGRRGVDVVLSVYEHVLGWVLARRATQALGVSAEAAAWVDHLGWRGEHKVASNAVDAEALGGGDRAGRSGALRVAFVARMEPGKGGVEAVEICERARELGGAIHLTVAGGGSQAEKVRRRVEGSGLAASFLGEVPHAEVVRILLESDVLLYPSRYPEGFPTILLEACALGCVPLSTPVPGALDLAEGDERFVQESAEGAAMSLVWLARDREALLRKAKDVQERVRTVYTWASTAQIIEDEIQETRTE